MRARVALAFVVVLLPAGCGAGSGGPRLAGAEAAPLIALSHRIGHEGACAQARDIRALQARAIRLVNAGRVPRSLQESFLGGVSALAAQAPPCLPSVPAAPAPPAPTTTTTTTTGDASGPGHGHGRGHGYGRGHGDGGGGD